MDEPTRDFADKAFRNLLQKPENLRALLREVVPQLVDGLLVEQLVVVSPQFLLPDSQGREADLLFEIPYRTPGGDEPFLVCVSIEHQSTPDPRMALRTLVYTSLYWDKKWTAWAALPSPKPAFRLTPVLPIVFYTGSRPWSSGRSIADLLGEPAALHPFAPVWCPVYWELSSRQPNDLLNADDGFIQALAIVRAEGKEFAEFEKIFRDLFPRLDNLHETNRIRWADLVNFVWGWIFHRRKRQDRVPLLNIVYEQVHESQRRQEVNQIMETYADELLARGMEKGMEKGREKGMIEGRAEEARRFILRLGLKRFGPLDPAIRVVLNATTDVERLERIGDRLVEATNWQDLLATP